MNTYRYMCDDLERAALNRNIISRKFYIWAYLQVEAYLKGTPVFDKLPYWIAESGIKQGRIRHSKRYLEDTNPSWENAIKFDRGSDPCGIINLWRCNDHSIMPSNSRCQIEC